jgi:ribosomal protein S18 acetylase RimI-like enzyme
MNFETIDIKRHRETVIAFRRDSFIVSFGDTSGFGKVEDYLHWLEEKVQMFPRGFVLVKEGGKYIGQLECSIRPFDGREIGYVHLYYLIPECRGKGIGKALHDYAMHFFITNDVYEYHLRVSPTNGPALKFYTKMGLTPIGPELDGKVLRMKGILKG